MLEKDVQYCIIKDVNGERFYFCGFGGDCDSNGNRWSKNAVIFSSAKADLEDTLSEINDSEAKVITVTFG